VPDGTPLLIRLIFVAAALRTRIAADGVPEFAAAAAIPGNEQCTMSERQAINHENLRYHSR